MRRSCLFRLALAAELTVMIGLVAGTALLAGCALPDKYPTPITEAELRERMAKAEQARQKKVAPSVERLQPASKRPVEVPLKPLPEDSPKPAEVAPSALQSAGSPFPTLDIQKLAHRSPAQIKAVLGTPRQIIPITGYPNQMPGEHRKYRVGRNGEMSVRFYRGRAVLFTWYFDEDDKDGPATPEAAVAALGVDVAATPPDVTAPAGRWWKGNFRGIRFARIGASKTDRDTAVWGCTQAALEGAPY